MPFHRLISRGNNKWPKIKPKIEEEDRKNMIGYNRFESSIANKIFWSSSVFGFIFGHLLLPNFSCLDSWRAKYKSLFKDRYHSNFNREH
jgi:hypothetical protein